MTSLEYIGSELELFAEAVNWKSYLRNQIAPYLGEQVLEVGAGIGETTRIQCDGLSKRWICLEPDELLGTQIQKLVDTGELPDCCEVRLGTIASSGFEAEFDSILYIDVLEHIEHDQEELDRAAGLLRPGGHLVVLSPAHQWLYSEFDGSIGHFRRYNRQSISQLEPRGLTLDSFKYLDSVGVIASASNRTLLRQSMPNRHQIGIWDRWMVPISRFIDPLVNYQLGKSVLAVWKKPE